MLCSFVLIVEVLPTGKFRVYIFIPAAVQESQSQQQFLVKSFFAVSCSFLLKEKTTKLCFFTSTKDKTPQLSQSNVIYEFICPGCNSSYIGKTNRTLLVRTQEHALTDKESAIYKHLHDCDNIKHIQDLYNLPDIFTNENNSPSTVMNKEFLTQTVRDNTNIIDRDDNWNLLLYKEAYHIKRLTPFLNNGLKASRELRLFS